MNYHFLHELLDSVAAYEASQPGPNQETNLQGYIDWLTRKNQNWEDPTWQGKELGRSAESVICTLLIHMGRYAKSYSKAAIEGSDFSTQDEFIFLINLKAHGSMTKMELIKLNKQEKPGGIQTINRLIKMGWINQVASKEDKRAKQIHLTPKGEQALDAQMDKIRIATKIVSGNLSNSEKNQLIHLLTKLDLFHEPIYEMHPSTDHLLDIGIEKISTK